MPKTAPIYRKVSVLELCGWKGCWILKPIVFKFSRLHVGITQKQLAEKLDVSESLISKIEAGTKSLTAKTEIKFMDVLLEYGVDVELIYVINESINPVKK